MLFVKYTIPKNRVMTKMNIIPRKIISSFPYFPNLRANIVFITGIIAATPAMMNSSDLCSQRLGFQLKSKCTGIISGSDWKIQSRYPKKQKD